MDATGQDLVSFLENVNGLHDRITSTFIGYVPPHFEVEAESGNVLLRYESTREGLTPFVIGIVKGLAERFGQEVTIDNIEPVEVDAGETSLIRFIVKS